MEWDTGFGDDTQDNSEQEINENLYICKKSFTASRGLQFFKGDEIEYLKTEESELKPGTQLVFYLYNGEERKLNELVFKKCFKKKKIKKVKKKKENATESEDDGLFGGGGGDFGGF